MVESLQSVLTVVFGGDYPQSPLALYQIASRSVVVYMIGMTAIRVGKSRMIGRATGLDVVLGFLLGSLLSRGINGSGSLSGTAIASAVLVGMHWGITAAACRSHALGCLLKGNARLLVRDGVILHDNMAKSHLSEHDLVEELRLNANIEDVAEVAVAYKERSGEIGIVRRK